MNDLAGVSLTINLIRVFKTQLLIKKPPFLINNFISSTNCLKNSLQSGLPSPHHIAIANGRMEGNSEIQFDYKLHME